jgi:hypothetical protein
MRTLVANAQASHGKAWVDLFVEHNSGTYNNQFMVVDMARFEPGQDLKPGRSNHIGHPSSRDSMMRRLKNAGDSPSRSALDRRAAA